MKKLAVIFVLFIVSLKAQTALTYSKDSMFMRSMIAQVLGPGETSTTFVDLYAGKSGLKNIRIKLSGAIESCGCLSIEPKSIKQIEPNKEERISFLFTSQPDSRFPRQMSIVAGTIQAEAEDMNGNLVFIEPEAIVLVTEKDLKIDLTILAEIFMSEPFGDKAVTAILEWTSPQRRESAKKLFSTISKKERMDTAEMLRTMRLREASDTIREYRGLYQGLPVGMSMQRLGPGNKWYVTTDW